MTILIKMCPRSCAKIVAQIMCVRDGTPHHAYLIACWWVIFYKSAFISHITTLGAIVTAIC